MRLSDKAIEAINTRAIILRLALELDFTELWVNKLIAANKDKKNTALTSAAALKVIREETGLSDQEILVEETISEGAKV